MDETRIWEQALQIEPFPQVWIAGERADAAFVAIAAFTNLKSPWLREHSTGVAELAEAAAADCYGAMREARPYRPALDAPAAEAELMQEAEDGRLDPKAVDAVLAAAGHPVRKRARELPARLTERELEVLLVLARGESNQEIAEDLILRVLPHRPILLQQQTR